jgi:ferrochelatase
VSDVREYLREFLADPDVVQVPRIVWWPLLHGIILPFRAPRSARLYERIWTAEGSPLLVHSRKQRDALAHALGEQFQVALGMRYGAPSIRSAIDELEQLDCDPVIAAPLFPQYSTTTTGSVLRAVRGELARRDRAVRLLEMAPWHASRGYIDALAELVRGAAGGQRIDHYVISFHGIPESYAARGDPYGERCRETATALARQLGLDEAQWSLVFQSRFGPQAWLRPYADDLVPSLARTCRRVLVTMPGFVADCLETLEEIGLRLRDRFREAGGEELVVVPALNEDPRWIASLAEWVRGALESELGGRGITRS